MTLRIRGDQMAALQADRFGRKIRQHIADQLAGLARVEPRGTTGLDVTDDEGRTARIDWEAGSIRITTPEGRVSRLELDEYGEVRGLVDPGGHRTALVRNDDHRLVAVERADGSRFDFTYGLGGRLRRIRFPDESRETYRYDADGELSEVDLDGQRQLTIADGDTERSYRDALGRRTRFTFVGGEDRPTTIELPDGTEQRFDYDGRGFLRQMWLGQRLHAQYETDTEGRITAVDFAEGGSLAFRHDGELLSYARNDQHEARFRYGAHERLIEERIDGETTRFDYNKVGEPTGLELPSGERVSFLRDGDGRVSEVRDWQGGVYRLHYDEVGNLSGLSFPNGVVTRLTQNALGLDTRIETTAPDGQPIVDRRYDYDARDRVARMVTEHGYERRYRYDAAGRLQGVRSELRRPEVGGLKGAPYLADEDRARWGIRGEPLADALRFDGDGDFGVDAAGNRGRFPEGQGRYNDLDQLVERGKEQFGYHDTGALAWRRGPDGEWRYVYTDNDRLAEVWKNNERVARYEYDALGRRLLKETPERTTRYLWAAVHLVGERTTFADGRTEARDYLYLPGEYLPLAMRLDGRIYYAHTDRLGAPLCFSDEAGRVVWRADYSAFGQALILEREIDQPLRLPGQFFDPETGLHYSLGRYYDPGLGRFVSRDPLGVEGGSLNLYLYGDGDPVNQLDPLGTFAFLAAALIIGAGALIGGAVKAGIEIYKQKKKHKKVESWGKVAKEAGTGAVVGAVGAAVGAAAAAVAGVGTAAVGATTLVVGAVASAVGGAVGGAVETCVEAGIRGEDVKVSDVLINAGIGAGVGLVTFGAFGFLGRKLRALRNFFRGADDGADDLAKAADDVDDLAKAADDVDDLAEAADDVDDLAQAADDAPAPAADDAPPPRAPKPKEAPEQKVDQPDPDATNPRPLSRKPVSPRTGLDKEADDLIELMPHLSEEVVKAKKAGYTFELGPEGQGSYTNHGAKKIVIEGRQMTLQGRPAYWQGKPMRMRKGTREDFLADVAHEAGHANDPRKVSLPDKPPNPADEPIVRQQTVEKNLQIRMEREGEAALCNLEAAYEHQLIPIKGVSNDQIKHISTNYPESMRLRHQRPGQQVDPAQRDAVRKQLAESWRRNQPSGTPSGTTYESYYRQAELLRYDRAMQAMASH